MGTVRAVAMARDKASSERLSRAECGQWPAAVSSCRKESRSDPVSLHEKMKIGILDQTCAGWSGGASYTRILLASLAATRANGSADADPASPPHDNRLVFLARGGNIGPSDRVQSASFTSVLQAYITSGRISEFGFGCRSFRCGTMLFTIFPPPRSAGFLTFNTTAFPSYFL